MFKWIYSAYIYHLKYVILYGKRNNRFLFAINCFFIDWKQAFQQFLTLSRWLPFFFFRILYQKRKCSIRISHVPLRKDSHRREITQTYTCTHRHTFISFLCSYSFQDMKEHYSLNLHCFLLLSVIFIPLAYFLLNVNRTEIAHRYTHTYRETNKKLQKSNVIYEFPCSLKKCVSNQNKLLYDFLGQTPKCLSSNVTIDLSDSYLNGTHLNTHVKSAKILPQHTTTIASSTLNNG